MAHPIKKNPINTIAQVCTLKRNKKKRVQRNREEVRICEKEDNIKKEKEERTRPARFGQFEGGNLS